MKDKMVLSCLKLKQNSFKPLKQSMFAFTTKTKVWKNTFRKNSKARRGSYFNRKNIVLIIL